MAARTVLAPAAALLLPWCAAAGAQPPAITDLGNGVYAFIGSTNEASPDNRAEVGNAGFIVGAIGTVVINTGGSYRHGRQILEAAERVGGKPVVLAVITQPLQEFIMGNAAFAERGVPLLAHEAGAELIADRCEICLRNLTRMLGDDAMRGTKVVVPTRTIKQSTEIDAGGRKLQLLHYGWGSTPGDLAVFDPESGTLFAGALVSIGRLPELRDADTRGWIQALSKLAALPVRALIPGYGLPGEATAMEPIRRYIELATARTGALQQGGASLYETVRKADVPEFAHWNLYPLVHPRNIQRIYLQIENEEFGR